MHSSTVCVAGNGLSFLKEEEHPTGKTLSRARRKQRSYPHERLRQLKTTLTRAWLIWAAPSQAHRELAPPRTRFLCPGLLSIRGRQV